MDIKMNESTFIDLFLDQLYLSGEKEDGKYILTLTQATEAAKQMYLELKKESRQ